MALYRFHISDSKVAFLDEDGLNLPAPSAALEEAAATAWVLMRELAEEICDRSDWRVNVVDESGSVVLVLSFQHLPKTSEIQSAAVVSRRAMHQ
jgi:hypothetical protein